MIFKKMFFVTANKFFLFFLKLLKFFGVFEIEKLDFEIFFCPPTSHLSLFCIIYNFLKNVNKFLKLK